MTARSYAFAGVVAAPIVALGIGVWAEFAELTPPVLLAVASPAILLSTLCAAYRAGVTTRPVVTVLLGGAIGLATFSIAAGFYIALHLMRGGGLDLNGADDGGSAGVFFLVHVAVGTIAGLALGCVVALVLWAGNAIRLSRIGRAPRDPLLQ
ncbi:MAG: hypothetical protein WEB04_06770 [Dehalococcoidia bacterium]